MVMASPIHTAAVAPGNPLGLSLGAAPDPVQMLSIGSGGVEILAQTKV
jgi:hypothetical protein